LKIRERLKIIFNHPLGYVITWIVAFGIIALSGRSLAGYTESIENKQQLLLALNISMIATVLIAIGIIAAGFRTSHFKQYSKRALLITGGINLVIFLSSAYLIRLTPGSVSLIVINGLSLVIFSFSVGELLSREVLSSGHLIPVAVVLALVDFWSVIGGPSRQIAKDIAEFAGKEGYTQNLPPPWTSFLLLRFPQFLMREIYSFLGIGDLVILAFLIGCIHRFNLPVKASYSALILGTVLAVLVANLLVKAIPVLPVIALLFILANFRHLHMKKSDLLISAFAIGIIAIIIITVELLGK
jgi:hypothetical protein